MKPKPLVMFIDDERPVLEGLQRALKSLAKSAETIFETSPFAGFEAAKDKKPAVVVCDITMPGMNGLDLVKNLREHCPHTKFIMLTGSADLNAAIGAINDARVFRFHTKPCDTSLLSDSICSAIEEWQSENGATDTQPGFAERVGAAALNHLGLAVVIMDHKARILFTNNAGAEVFSKEDGLLWGQDNICRVHKPEDTKKLHNLVVAASNNDNTALGQGILAISRPSHSRSYNGAICSLRPHGDHQNYAIMFLSDPEKSAAPRPEIIQALFDLTPAESKLAHSIAQGERIETAAQQNGVTLSTARTYLKQIFQKTQTNRQSELVRLIISADPVH